MKSLLSILFFLSMYLYFSKRMPQNQEELERFTMSNEVLELDPKNYTQFSELNDVYMMNFYNPDSKASKKFNKIYAKIAAEFSSRKIMFGKMNILKHESMIDHHYEIKAYPAVYWINRTNSEEIDKILYYGEYTEKNLRKFIKNKLRSHIELINSLDDFKGETKKLNNAILFVGDRSTREDIVDSITNLATNVAGIDKVLWTLSADLKEKFEMEVNDHDKLNVVFFYDLPNYDAYKVYKVKDDSFLARTDFLFTLKLYSKATKFGQISKGELAQIKRYSFPSFIYIYNHEDESQNKLHNALSQMSKAEAIKHKVLMYSTTFDNPDTKELVELYRVNKPDLPVLTIYNNKYDEVVKYKKSKEKFKETELDNVVSFLTEHSKLGLERFYMSEKIPKNGNYNNTIQNLVGMTINSFLRIKNKDHVVLFVDRQDKEYARLRGMLDRVAQKIFPNNRRIVIGEIDVSKNELDSHGIDSVPALVVFKEKPKYNTQDGIFFHGDYTTQEMMKFIAANVKNKLTNIVTLDQEEALNKEEASKPIVVDDDKYEELERHPFKKRLSDVINEETHNLTKIIDNIPVDSSLEDQEDEVEHLHSISDDIHDDIHDDSMAKIHDDL